MSTLAHAIAQMRADGMPEFPPGHPVVDGKIHRYGPKNKDGSAWYKLHEFRTRKGDLVIVGAYGDWRRGRDSFRRIEVDWKEISREERAETERRIREAQERERQKREELADKAATRARLRWKGAYTLEQARERGMVSPYVERKGVEPESARVMLDGTLIVPMMLYDEADGSRLVGIQYIFADGKKRFSRNVARIGACCRLGTPPTDGDVILMCEGWATGLSLRMATMHTLPVFVAFDAGGLAPAAEIMRARYPSSPIVFCADDDWKTEIAGVPFNVGVEKATAAALAVRNAWVIRPMFREADRQEKWTDWNDLHLAYGIPELQRQLTIARMIEKEEPVGGRAPPPEEDEAPDPEPAGDASAEGGAGGGGQGGDGPPEGPPPEGADTPPQPDGEPQPPKRRTWYDELQRTATTNAVKSSVHNAFLYLTNHRDWKGVLGFDTFSEVIWKLKPPPFADGAAEGEWTELDDHRLLLWLSRRIGEPGTEALQKAVQLAAHQNEFNPLRDRLEGLRHDGAMRVRTWLKDYLGVCTGPEFERLPQADKDRALTYMELVGTKWLVAAVRRVYEPGCRVDNMLILEGGQGALKSTTLKVLGDRWFTDATLRFEDKDSLLIIQGRWIVEMAELEGMNKADTSATKKFLTQHVDLFRPPYGRKLVQYPRRCIFAGSVNYDVYLKDDSGNRRFWPVRVESIAIEQLRQDVDQLWAEAVAMHKAGVPHWVLPHEKHLFEEAQEARFDTDAWEGTVLDYLDGTGEFVLGGGRLDKVKTEMILGMACLKLDKARWDRQAKIRVVGILRRNGWVRRKDSAGDRQWWYVRPDPPKPAKVGPEPAGGEGGGDGQEGGDDPF